MRSFDRYALSVGAAAALLAACNGPQLPASVPAALPKNAIANSVVHLRSWMLPEAKNENLMYIADPATGGVEVYSYRPARYKFVGFLLGLAEPEGECVDKAQNIYVANGSAGGSQAVFEYAHGGTNPIRILGVSGYPLSCAIDPTTGNLAVIAFNEKVNSFVALFKKARGKPTIFTDAGFGMNRCTYDPDGNFFMDGSVVSGNLQFAEMPKGSTVFQTVSLNVSFVASGGVEWDGRHVAVGDAYEAKIYRFEIAGGVGTKVGATRLYGPDNVGQFFVARGRVIAPSFRTSGGGYIRIYDYPAGGVANRTLSNFSTPVAAVVSYRILLEH